LVLRYEGDGRTIDGKRLPRIVKGPYKVHNRATALDILHKIDRFALTSEGDVKQLQRIDPPVLRLRVGDYRVRFYDVADTITILTVKHRSEAYR